MKLFREGVATQDLVSNKIILKLSYGVERQRNGQTKILTSYVFNVGTPLRPIHHYSQYAITASNGQYAIMASNGQYAITANMPLRPICHYGQ
jgi:hypothetical protein